MRDISPAEALHRVVSRSSIQIVFTHQVRDPWPRHPKQIGNPGHIAIGEGSGECVPLGKLASGLKRDDVQLRPGEIAKTQLLGAMGVSMMVRIKELEEDRRLKKECLFLPATRELNIPGFTHPELYGQCCHQHGVFQSPG